MTRPHVLFLVVDELRPECVGFEGNRDVRTPNLDALARDGVRFARSYCTAPVCAPSRYSLLSGTYVHEHRGSTNFCTMLPHLETFPRLLNRAGYRTDAIGKMHLTPTYLDVGFERMLLAEQDGPGRFEDDYHRELMREGLVDSLDIMDQRKEFRDRAPRDYWETFGAAATSLPEQWHSTTWIGDRAMEVVGEWDGSRPQCAMVSFVKPHHPFDPPGRWLEMYNADVLELLPGWTQSVPEQDLQRNGGYFPHASLDEKALRRVMAHYYATISHVDEQVGRLVALLKSRELYDSTLIVFTADHGDYMGFHHMLLKANHAYEPLIRVPLVMKFPGGLNGGGKRDDLVSLVDVPATILGYAGVRAAPTMRGLDLSLWPTNRHFVCAQAGHSHSMARSQRFKLLLNHADPTDNLFFDLELDPLELQNVGGKFSLRNDIECHLAAIENWMTGQIPTPPHLDLKAATISATMRNPAVEPDSVRQYYADAMDKSLR